jgi:hypothetical protein
MIMEIPIIPLCMRNGIALTSDITFDGYSLSMAGGRVDYDILFPPVARACGRDGPMIVADIEGMRRRDIMPDVLRKIGTKRETWFMTCIRNADDLMDSFSGNAESIAVPYHFTSDRSLKEMTEMSDRCIPALFMDPGGVHTSGIKKDALTLIRSLENMNFGKILTFDISGTYRWDRISDHADTVIPFVRYEDRDSAHKAGFDNIMVSAVRLFHDVRQRS